jgi:hypothetical protein
MTVVRLPHDLARVNGRRARVRLGMRTNIKNMAHPAMEQAMLIALGKRVAAQFPSNVALMRDCERPSAAHLPPAVMRQPVSASPSVSTTHNGNSTGLVGPNSDVRSAKRMELAG